MNQNQYAIGVDIGGTNLRIACIDVQGHILEHIEVPTHAESGVSNTITHLIDAIKKLISTKKSPPIGIGIGVAGQIDSKNGIVNTAPNLKWQNIPIKTLLEDELKIPTAVSNDVRVATLGEWLFGAGKNCQDFICLFIGTGIGSGIVSGGQLLIGNSNTAGEVGHTTVDYNGFPCSCGNKGCLEAYAGGWGIAANANRKKPNAIPYTAMSIIELYHQKDPFATEIINQCREALVAGVASLVNAFNPKRIILGGGMYSGLPEIKNWLEEGVPKRALKVATKDLEIVSAKLKNNAGIIGAASMMFCKEKTCP